MAVKRYLINDAGDPFDPSEMQALTNQLDGLENVERTHYRNENASAIAQHGAIRFLIVSGPGTGKSYLFLERIDHWFRQDPQAKVLVTSFVRKLVVDLENEINSNVKLSAEQKKNVSVSTLHRLARSIVERNHGTREWKFERYFRIIGQFWKDVVWHDVLAFYPSLDKEIYSWKKFEDQLHNANYDHSDEWQELKSIYFSLCKFYNAAGFADLIVRATDALKEIPGLIESTYFIIDEYQDFNVSENELILQLAQKPKGVLVVGDDEQVLYENLKSGIPTLIRNLYKDNNYVNGMLPFCSRSSFHITKVAGFFIDQHRDEECIEKIFLPIRKTDDYPKVQIIACATPATAVDYIQRFVNENKAEIDDRRDQLAIGEATDAFLLILSPTKEVRFYRNSRNIIDDIVAEYMPENRTFSEDYYKLLNYYSLSNYTRNNFIFRKVMYYENLAEHKVHELLDLALREGKNFYELDIAEIVSIVQKCEEVKNILDDEEKSNNEKIAAIAHHVTISDEQQLYEDLVRRSINKEEVISMRHEEEEEAELEEIEVKKMGAVELMTIVGSKGLSADHVIIIGFDDVNMNYVTQNAFVDSTLKCNFEGWNKR
jgi:superfamily I DNA/RNA helicase